MVEDGKLTVYCSEVMSIAIREVSLFPNVRPSYVNLVLGKKL